jgi:hypothetical protein
MAPTIPEPPPAEAVAKVLALEEEQPTRKRDLMPLTRLPSSAVGRRVALGTLPFDDEAPTWKRRILPDRLRALGTRIRSGSGPTPGEEEEAPTEVHTGVPARGVGDPTPPSDGPVSTAPTVDATAPPSAAREGPKADDELELQPRRRRVRWRTVAMVAIASAGAALAIGLLRRPRKPREVDGLAAATSHLTAQGAEHGPAETLPGRQDSVQAPSFARDLAVPIASVAPPASGSPPTVPPGTKRSLTAPAPAKRSAIDFGI